MTGTRWLGLGRTSALITLLGFGAIASVAIDSAPAQETPAWSRLSPEAWSEDLRVMSGLLVRLHADAFHTTTPAPFEEAVRDLGARIPELVPHEIVVEMARIAASIGDGHTRLNLFPGSPGVPQSPEDGFVRLPLRLQWFAEGVFVRSATSELAPLVGGRVIEIGRVPIDDAIERVRQVVHGDNEMTRRLLVPGYLGTPAVLRATGVTDRSGPVRIVVETVDGRMTERHLDARRGADAGEVDVATAPGVELPLWLQSRGRPYWFERVPEGRAVYVQLNASRPADDEPMPEFAARLRRLLEREDVERVVLDLRRNGGGDSELTRPLVAALAGWQAGSSDRRLFVLIGRATFSAAVVLAAELERFTRATFVGEPTGGRPNQYGEIETFALPNSGLTVSYASLYFQTAGPGDARPWVPPDLAVDLRFEEFAAGRDPTLAKALSYDIRAPSLGENLVVTAREAGLDAALEAYRRFRAAPEHRYAHTERALTGLVIDQWRRGEVAASLPTALLAAEEFPMSFEAHENVAEIYADQENTAEAARWAIESLRLGPGNGDALRVLRDVCGDDVLQAYLGSDPTTDSGRTALRDACGG